MMTDWHERTIKALQLNKKLGDWVELIFHCPVNPTVPLKMSKIFVKNGN